MDIDLNSDNYLKKAIEKKDKKNLNKKNSFLFYKLKFNYNFNTFNFFLFYILGWGLGWEVGVTW